MKAFHLVSLLTAGLSLATLTACSQAQSGTDPDEPVVAGTLVTLELGAAAQADKSALDAELDDVKHLDAAGFASRTAVSFEPLGYAGKDAAGLDIIQGSYSALNDAELSKLDENGFVISTRVEYPTFAYGYASLYADDLPLFVSADSILYALHRSYDSTLKALELQSLSPQVSNLLRDMHQGLATGSRSADVQADVDLFLTVARSLLAGELVAPFDSAVSDKAKKLYDKCVAASGAETIVLFGSPRIIDFSQCQPRGHYTDDPRLEKYFRAMMWLGNTDFRLIETQEDGSQLFQRRQLEAALALRELMTDSLFESHQAVDGAITAFVGEHDYMTVPQLDELEADLGIESLSELSTFTDQELAQAIVSGGYGTQRISSHYMVNGVGGTLPLSSSFALFGQRYTIDSHVFSNVVFDRAGGGSVLRMMPNPLDAAYAALGSDHAGMLLAPELQKYAYAPDLAAMRVLVDTQQPDYWSQNLYTSWLGALRALSPATALDASDTPLPAIARTEAWGRRLLNTQLASWAELRHDTILYTKQSYTSGNSCEFPDAYVEPYPEFFARVKAYADRAAEVLQGLPSAPSGSVEHYQHFSTVAGTLQEMAEYQRTGAEHSAEHMAFINEAVHVESICGEAHADGWYPKLFYATNSTEADPTIADVHTQPTDESGAEVGKVLHVGTGMARLMVVTFDTCAGPRAYAGLASSYYEHITENFERLTDPEWNMLLATEPLPAPEWASSILSESP